MRARQPLLSAIPPTDQMDELGGMDDVMGKAVRLKSAQIKAERPIYESSPAFYRCTLFLVKDLAEQRKLPIDERLEVAGAMKDAGNGRYAQGALEEAYREYTRALGCVRYFEPTEANWRDGFTDATLREVFVQDLCHAPRQALRLHELLLACYLNIAQVRLAERREYAEAVAACDEAIALDPSCAKAYFRRARARYEPLSSTSVEQELALKDLAMAARLAPADAIIRRELERLRAEERAQRDKERSTFDGLFARGPALYDEEEERKYVARRQREEAEAEKAHNARSMATLETMIARREAAGETEKAEEMRAQVRAARAKAEAEAEARARIDYHNLTEADFESHAREGIDLRDPLVLRAVQKLQANHERRRSDELPLAEPELEGSEGGAEEVQAERPRRLSSKVRMMLVALAATVLQLCLVPLLAAFYGRTLGRPRAPGLGLQGGEG